MSSDTSSAAGSPSASGAIFILQGGKDHLSDYIGKLIEVRASIDQASQKVPEVIGTSGSDNPPKVESENWPRARVKEIHSVGDCTK